MAVTTEYSTEYAAAVNATQTPVMVNQWHGRLRIQTFNFTQGAAAGDATSLAVLCKLPPGKCRIILPLSYVGASAMGTSRTMDLGHLAYSDLDGDAVAADPDDLDADIDVSAATTTTPGGTLGAGENKLYESQDGVSITAQINDGTIPAAATITGFFAYVID
jgi:hypothetical protein